jgi:hypothetical protein
MRVLLVLLALVGAILLAWELGVGGGRPFFLLCCTLLQPRAY